MFFGWGREVVEEYKFLFPFEEIPAGSKIVIYGAGILGQAYLQRLLISRYCDVVGMVDRNYKKYSSSAVEVFSPTQIHALVFDYILLAVRGYTGTLDIKKQIAAQRGTRV